ncbi:unnamed protein product [Effrenium voratum]|uniref:Uncharacterized protein n=1 Tax=Effrenium voratum TaxID=2562239 RepID=A0AA36JKT2_9DINO|nr:unnamed protein product [Effrenium voratum]CAJ1416965.1 unnamed protein product [Effrenium voratum]
MARRRGSKRTIEERALDEAASPHSQLWTCIMELWAWGVLSSPIVQKLAQAARRSGCSAHDIDTLAQLGASGAHEGNCHRDLLRAYAARCVTPALSPVTCPTKVRAPEGAATLDTQQAVLPASHSLAGLGRRARNLLGRPEGLASRNGRRLLPCPHAEHDSIVSVSFRSLLAHQCDIAESMFLRHAQALVEDLNRLAHGLDHDGSALPLRAVVWVVSGDYEHMANEYGLPHWTSLACFWCSAPKEHFFAFADIPALTRSAEDMLDQDALDHPLKALTNYSPCMFAIDTLHCVDLGVAAHVYANVFHELTQEWPETKAASLSRLNKELRSHCVAVGSPAPPLLRYENFAPRSGEYPKLRHMKGAAIRRLAPAVQALAAAYGRGSAHRKRRARVAALLRAIYDSTSCRLVMPAAKHAEFARVLTEFLEEYAKLATSCRGNGWHVVFKFHMLRHLDEQSKHLSPRFVWTYTGETFMSFMCQIASSCSRGTPGRLLGVKVLQKYRVAQHLMLSQQIPTRSRFPVDELDELED